MIDLTELGKRIQAQEWDSPFTLHADGTIVDSDEWAPSVYHDDEDDILIDGPGWSAMTGLTGQYGYHGAVMHPSEFIGGGVAAAMLDEVERQERPVTFAITEVIDIDDPEALIGWAIVYHGGKS